MATALPHLVVADIAREPAVAHALELAVPACGRHPDLELDIRVGRWFDDAADAAEGRQVGKGFARAV